MVKTVLLSPSSVRKFNNVVAKFFSFVELCIIAAIALRFATFAVPASTGRILAPIAALLHLPGMMVFVAGMRTEYVNIIAQTFDFWFIEIASMLWAITFSAVLLDLRVILVVAFWINFTNSLFQETHLRNTPFMVVVSLWEWIFCMMLMIWLSLGLVDDVHHYSFIARGRTFSTKDVLVNALGTMTMLSLRNLYRRYRISQHQRNSPGTPAQALIYRCKIALSASGPRASSICPQIPTTTKANPSTNKRPLMQMYLVAEFAQIDPRNTVWPRIGALTPVATWKIVVLNTCGALGAGFATISVFSPSKSCGTKVIAVSAVVNSLFFSGIYTCCCQRQLLKSIVTSFHHLFLLFQVVAIGVCVVDMLNWQWVPACGVFCSFVLGQTALSVDALTPIMKHRLRFAYWTVVGSIVLFWLVHAVLLIDVLAIGRLNLQDRVFLEIVFFGQRSRFHVAPFLLSRVVTVLVWSGRYVFVALTRHNDNALILLRGNVKFDYESWKRQNGCNHKKMSG